MSAVKLIMYVRVPLQNKHHLSLIKLINVISCNWNHNFFEWVYLN